MTVIHVTKSYFIYYDVIRIFSEKELSYMFAAIFNTTLDMLYLAWGFLRFEWPLFA